MSRAQRRTAGRQRVGKVSGYLHHGSWHLYYREGGRALRRRVGGDLSEALRTAAEVNAQLASDRPTLFSFSPTTVAALRQRFLEHHEFVLNSSLATVNRYRSATNFLADFAGTTPAHRVDADRFLRHLRSLRVSPNGHPKTVKRPLREKGIRFVLETCRSLYGFAAKKRLLPPYFEITFAPAGLRRYAPDDAKPVYVFDNRNELAFFTHVTVWALPIFLTLAKTGLRPGELLHTLVEDLDLDGGWWHVRSKPGLDWWVKTRRDRAVPLVPELVDVLRRLLRGHNAGPVFLRERFARNPPHTPSPSCAGLSALVDERVATAQRSSQQTLSRKARARIARSVWREAGAVSPEALRQAFLAATGAIDLVHVTCPKCWRHTFATLLQEANVDPLIRQLTLGHAPVGTGSGTLGMTALYTHTSPALQHREIVRAIQLRPETLRLAAERMK